MATLATGGAVDEAARAGLDQADESIQLARTLLERLAEFVPPEAFEELRRGGSL